MPVFLLAALSLVVTAVDAPDITKGRSGVWTYDVYDDRFTGLRACRLHERHVRYVRHTLRFDLGSRTQTYDAVYRIDDGPAQTAASQQMAVAKDGVSLTDDRLANPSGGLVNIPAQTLKAGRMVTVRASARARPVSFDISGFNEALSAALAAGCPTDRFYD
jgi:hypothetical protein